MARENPNKLEKRNIIKRYEMKINEGKWKGMCRKKN